MTYWSIDKWGLPSTQQPTYRCQQMLLLNADSCVGRVPVEGKLCWQQLL